MKKHIITIIVFAAAFIVSLTRQHYTLLNQEALGLFLWTPDYLRDIFSEAWPISNLAGSFALQFFRIKFVAEALTAAIVTAIFLICRAILRRFGIGRDSISALCAAAAWAVVALSETPATGFKILFCALAALLICTLVTRKKELAQKGWGDIILSAAIIAAGATFVCTSGKVRLNEQWATVEIASAGHNWDAVLKVATPQVTQKERLMLPYALLALNGKGQLSARIGEYPVEGPEDLDTEGLNTRRAYQFSNVLYECLGCPNEAMHQAFQAACFLPHTSSFRTLRQLVIYNYTIGDYGLVRKYCEILSHSSCHKAFIRQFEKLMAEGEPRDISGENLSYEAGLITHDQRYNIVNLRNAGIESDIALDRFRAYLMFE